MVAPPGTAGEPAAVEVMSMSSMTVEPIRILSARIQFDAGNAFLVDEGAVGGLEVRHHAAVFASADRAVPARRGLVVDHHIAALQAAQRDGLPGGDRHRPARFLAGPDDELESHREMILGV